MSVKFFLLGRPGCGKSSAAKHVINYISGKGWSTYRFKDFDILQKMFEEDTQGRFTSSSYGGFDVVDPEVLDEALDALNNLLLSHVSMGQNGELLLIEFARSDYAKALQRFSPLVLQDAYFLFIDTDLDVCIQRVKQRMNHPDSDDDHYVSKKAIKKFYATQDLPDSDQLPGTLEKIENYGTLQEFIKKIDNIVDNIFK